MPNHFKCQDHDMDNAAAYGRLDVVKYLYENQIGTKGTDALTNALSYGHIEVAKFLVGIGCSCPTEYVEDMVKNDDLEIPKLLCEREGDNFDADSALVTALKHGNLKFAKFLYALNPTACARQGNHRSSQAAEKGYIEFIKFFHECGDPKFFDWRAMHAAATNGYLDIVKFLHENRDENVGMSTLSEAFE